MPSTNTACVSVNAGKKYILMRCCRQGGAVHKRSAFGRSEFCACNLILISNDRDITLIDLFKFILTKILFSLTCSVFGEDALVNVSVEKKEDNDGKLAGYIRIRSKTQGIALSLGDRITSVQRGVEK
jgi:hypothetical protein